MRFPLIRQGAGPAEAYEAERLERERIRQQAERASREGSHVDLQRTFGTPAGDERKLRGIPVQARGVQGAIPGSRP